jgi:hypothetical protein
MSHKFAAIIACPLYSMDYHAVLCWICISLYNLFCSVETLYHCFSSIALGGAIMFALTLFTYCFHLRDAKDGMCFLSLCLVLSSHQLFQLSICRPIHLRML